MANDTNGAVNFWGVPLDKWLSVFQTIGFPTLFMGFVLYMAWCYIPPIVAGHVKLLERTGDTLESVDKTLKQSNVILSEVKDVEHETKTFMQKAVTDHGSQNQKLDTIIDHTKAKP